MLDARTISTQLFQPAPPKRELFGIGVSITNYSELSAWVISRAAQHASATVAHTSVHGIVHAVLHRFFGQRLRQFDVVAPDGQPIRWALNTFHHANLADRVYGPAFMLHLCQQAAEADISIYLYGSTPSVIDSLETKLRAKYPALRIAGSEAPPFRPLTPMEDAAVIARINASGAGIVFLGLGCPKQEIFAATHADRIRAVQICVGAAFEFHAGIKRMAPSWMQRAGLEWLFRLAHEPRRLGRRYLVINTLFILLILRQIITRAPAPRSN
jgi:N-acetylglucosaminyldiphosphoundecaprenol N-acetyl-beta-D-mannosaminyltransferase